MNRLFKYHQFSRTFYKDLREFRYLRLVRASVSSTREPMKPESRPSSEQGLANPVIQVYLIAPQLLLWIALTQHGDSIL